MKRECPIKALKYYSDLKTEAIATSKIDKELDIDTELLFLFLSNAFARMYKDGVKKTEKEVDKFLNKMTKKSRGYSKRLSKCLERSQVLFEQAEANLKAKPKQRFGRNIVLDENGEIGVHGLLFSVALVLEHRNIKKRSLVLPYADAQKIYDQFKDMNDICHNALLVSKEFTNLVMKGV